MRMERLGIGSSGLPTGGDVDFSEHASVLKNLGCLT